MEIPAKPESIILDIERTALIVIDMQNDFATENGMFARAGIDVSMIRNAIGPTATVIQAARHAGMSVIYLKMGLRPDLRTPAFPILQTGFATCVWEREKR